MKGVVVVEQGEELAVCYRQRIVGGSDYAAVRARVADPEPGSTAAAV